MMKATLIVIKNQDDHSRATTLVDKLMVSGDPRDAGRLAVQARLIENYERRRWPRWAPSTVDVLLYLTDQHGLSRADMVPLLGTASRVSEILSGKRELSMSMIRRLRERFSVPADVLMPHSARKRMAA